MYRRSDWSAWVHFLQQRGWDGYCVLLLEAFAPALLLMAQVTRFGQPFLELVFSPQKIEAVAQLLEDKDETRSFIACLREGKTGLSG